MKKTDTAWAAGLIEGEGYIGITARRKVLQLRVSSSDKDVLQKLWGLFPTGRGVHVMFKRGQNGGAFISPPKYSKTIYRVYWYGARAEKVIRTVLPYLGKRRTRAALKSLSNCAKPRR